MMIGGTGTGYIPEISHERISHQDYGAIIEKSYRLLTTDKLRKIINDYKAKSPYERIWKTSPAEKTEYKVAVHILKERKGLEGKVK